MFSKLLPVFSAGALLFAGCATTSPKATPPWFANEVSKGQVAVAFQYESTLIPLSRALPYEKYRAIGPKEYEKHHVPAGASSAFVGRQGRYNYQVFYEIRNAQGGTDLYNFSFGKFDIDLPAKLLAQVDARGDVKTLRVIE